MRLPRWLTDKEAIRVILVFSALAIVFCVLYFRPGLWPAMDTICSALALVFLCVELFWFLRSWLTPEKPSKPPAQTGEASWDGLSASGSICPKASESGFGHNQSPEIDVSP